MVVAVVMLVVVVAVVAMLVLLVVMVVVVGMGMGMMVAVVVLVDGCSGNFGCDVEGGSLDYECYDHNSCSDSVGDDGNKD